MIKDNKDGSYNFGIRGIEYEVFYTEDGMIELYEVNDPGKTGFIFPNDKVFYLFINSLTDVTQKKQDGGLL